MNVYHKLIKVKSDKYKPVFHDVTEEVKKIVEESGIKNGTVTIYSQHTTCSVIVQEEAHDYGLPVIAWMYPRGRYVPNDTSTSMLSYAARIGMELGADIVKMKYNGQLEEYKWIVKCAGKTRVVVAGGPKLPDKEFLKQAKDVMQTGASGMAIGRNIWKHETPIKITAALKSIIFDDASVEDAVKLLK